MSISTATGPVSDTAILRNAADRHLGDTEWQEMTRERVDRSTDVTEDNSFIHVDSGRSKSIPAGETSGQSTEVTDILGRAQVKPTLTLDVRRTEQPALVADSLMRFY
ncbi:MAG: hypothetical protein JO262_03035 [Solirubrobacterales bacterium]|nr:hypothetical protein [Solirubrobacterales bacterium]MBV9941080.1 hypothetical protein [Solirubrobacterales bacterium]